MSATDSYYAEIKRLKAVVQEFRVLEKVVRAMGHTSTISEKNGNQQCLICAALKTLDESRA